MMHLKPKVFNNVSHERTFQLLDTEYVKKKGYQRLAFFNEVIADYFNVGYNRYWEVVKGAKVEGYDQKVVDTLLKMAHEVAAERLKKKHIK